MSFRTLLFLGLLGVMSQEASAQSLADEADAHFNAAVRAYQAGRFNDALLHFMQSNRLSPNPTVAANIGHSYVALEKYPEAYRWYANAHDLTDDARVRDQLATTMKSLEGRVVLYDVTSSPPGATVYVDRRALGAVATTPATIALSPGEHSLIFELDKHHPVRTPKARHEKLGERIVVRRTLDQITGRLVVSGMPDVEVYDAGVRDPICVTPCVIDIPIGQHVLQLKREGYRTQPALVELGESESQRLEANLEPITGTLRLDASVEGAEVKVDGETLGYTPLVARAPVGEHEITVSAQGYESSSLQVDVPDGETLDLGEVKLSAVQLVTLASRVAEDVFTAPSSVSVVSRGEMEAFGYPTVAEALRGVRGVTAINADEDSLVMVRGVGTASNRGTQTKVLMNGVPLTDQLTGRQYIYSRSQNVESIEVQRGSGSVLYGSGALTGLVSLQTRGRTQGAFATGSLGFFGNEGRLNSVAGAGDEEVGAWVSVGAVYGDGDQATIPFTRESGQYVAQPTAIADYAPWRGAQFEGRAWSGDAEMWMQVADDTVDVTSGAEGSILQNAAGEEVSNPTNIQQMTVGMNYRPALTDKTDLDLSVHYRQVLTSKDNTWRRPTGTPPLELLVGQNTAARWVGAGAQITSTPAPGVRAVAGAEVYRSLELSLDESARTWLYDENRYSYSVTEFGFQDAQAVYAAYGVLDYQPIDELKFSTGVRLDKWYALPAQANPRLAMMVIPTRDDVIKLMLGRSFRAPVTFEQKYFVESISIPAQDLGPESGWSGEIEWAHRVEAWTGLFSGWASSYDNVIGSAVDPTAGGMRRYANAAGTSNAYGFDVEARRDFLAGTMFSAWYSYQRSRVADSEGNTTAASEQPTHLAALKVVRPIWGNGLNAAVRVVYEGARPYRINTLEGQVPDAVLADLVFSGRSRDGTVGWRAGVYNALNVGFNAATLNNTASPVLPQTRGRTFMASVEYTGRVRDEDQERGRP